MYIPDQRSSYYASEEYQRFCACREIKQRGIGIGLAVASMQLIPLLLSTVGYIIMMLLGFVNEYQYREEFMFMQPEVYYVYYMILYTCMVVLPFAILIPIFHMRRREVFPSRGVGRPGLAFLASVGGLAVCVVANFLTNQWSYALEGIFGIVDLSSGMPMGDSLAAKIMCFFICAVLPPLAEEFSFRGVVFGLLRPYGKRIAIIGSAFVFAIMHGNLTQIPFAFIGGLFFGVLVAETGSIWPAVFLHFLNNAASVLQEMALNAFDTMGFHVIYISFIAFAVIGILCLALVLRKNPAFFRLQEDHVLLAERHKFKEFSCNVGMIICYVVIALQILMMISVSPR